MHQGSPSAFFWIVLLASLLLDGYVVSGLLTLTKAWRLRWHRWLVCGGYLLFSVGIMLLFFAGFSAFRTPIGMTPYHEWILSLFLTSLITKIFFCVAMLLGDLGRLIAGLVRAFKRPKPAGRTIPSRRKFIAQTAGIFAAIPFTGFMYAMLKGKYDYRVHHQTLWFEDLPAAFDGFTITQLSDIHSGSFDNSAAVRKGIELAQAQKSDLFVFTGDLVNNAAWEIEPYLADFSTLRAPYGQFSVLGNHDYGDYVDWPGRDAKIANLQKLKEHHATMGYRLLMDENVRIEKDGQSIHLIGVQNWGRGFVQHGNLDKAVEGIDPSSFKILLSHDPSHWEDIVRYHPSHVHLTLSGHTHGAQFGVETDKWRWSPVQYRYLDWAGPAVDNNRHLYVNRGFGFLAFSGRLGIWPEITVVTLKKKTGAA